MDPIYIEVAADVRYWEDATVNGVEDKDGTLIQFRNHDAWCPVIRLSDGKVQGWDLGTVADVHYKVWRERWHLMHLSEPQVRSVLVKNGYTIHDDSDILIAHHLRVANDLADLFPSTTKQQPAAPVMPAEQMGMF